MIDWNDPKEACVEYRRLDAKFGTPPESPLHHDSRCKIDGNLFMVEHFAVIMVG